MCRVHSLCLKGPMPSFHVSGSECDPWNWRSPLGAPLEKSHWHVCKKPPLTVRGVQPFSKNTCCMQTEVYDATSLVIMHIICYYVYTYIIYIYVLCWCLCIDDYNCTLYTWFTALNFCLLYNSTIFAVCRAYSHAPVLSSNKWKASDKYNVYLYTLGNNLNEYQTTKHNLIKL